MIASEHDPMPCVPYWVDPETHHAYPTSYRAYRRARECQEKSPPRHCRLGPAVDHDVWLRWRRTSPSVIDVVVTLRADAPPRVRRLVSEVLRSIRRGRPAPEAIRRTARRFGLRDSRARALIAAGIAPEQRHAPDTAPLAAAWTFPMDLDESRRVAS